MPDLTPFTLEREFIGYGYNTPDPKWPSGAKIAINFIAQYNIGSERSPDEGDKDIEHYLPEMDMRPPGFGQKCDMIDSQFEYGPRVGVPRLLDMFKRLGVPLTWNVYTAALEKSPYWTKAILDSGSEILLGGDRWIDYADVEPQVEDKMIREAIEKIQAITGDKTAPAGFFTDRRSNSTIKLYLQAMADKGLPLQYSSDSCSDDLPFWTESPVSGQKGLLMVPFSYDVSDLKFNLKMVGPSTPKDYYETLMDTFECLYNEGVKGEPKMMTVLLHPHIIGRATRSFWLEKFLEHLKTVPDVWIATRGDIAKHFASVHPFDSAKAFGKTPAVPDIKFPGKK